MLNQLYPNSPCRCWAMAIAFDIFCLIFGTMFITPHRLKTPLHSSLPMVVPQVCNILYLTMSHVTNFLLIIRFFLLLFPLGLNPELSSKPCRILNDARPSVLRLILLKKFVHGHLRLSLQVKSRLVVNGYTKSNITLMVLLNATKPDW